VVTKPFLLKTLYQLISEMSVVKMRSFKNYFLQPTIIRSIQQSNKNGATRATGSECNTSPLVSFMAITAACIAVMVLQSYKFNHFCVGYDTSNKNNHTIRAPKELVVDSGGTKSQGISEGAIYFSGAIPAIFLVFMTGLIQSVHAIGSW
jgi:hypothetical protein